MKRAAREEGVGAAVAKAEEHGWAPDEVRAVLGKKAASSLQEALTGGSGAFDDEPAPKSAQEIEGLALATLRHVMKKCPQDGPRVAAAKEVLARADAERVAAGLGGKKGAQKAAAEARVASGGKFTPPRAPGTMTTQ